MLKRFRFLNQGRKLAPVNNNEPSAKELKNDSILCHVFYMRVLIKSCYRVV